MPNMDITEIIIIRNMRFIVNLLDLLIYTIIYGVSVIVKINNG